jgi:predicted ATPase
MPDFLAKLTAYAQEHWGATHLPDELRQFDAQTILPQVIADITTDATQTRQLVRIAGQSGSGKTTQLLPAAEAYFAHRQLHPVLVAARSFVQYHPHLVEIREQFGEENLRENTHEFTVIMMFLTLSALIANGYDIILDVTLLDPMIESVLNQMLTDNRYQSRIFMIAVSKEISDQFIGKRANRKVKSHTADEFWRVTQLALNFYAQNLPTTPITVWSAFDPTPVYSGTISDALSIIKKYQSISELPQPTPTETQLRRAKIEFVKTL